MRNPPVAIAVRPEKDFEGGTALASALPSAPPKRAWKRKVRTGSRLYRKRLKPEISSLTRLCWQPRLAMAAIKRGTPHRQSRTGRVRSTKSTGPVTRKGAPDNRHALWGLSYPDRREMQVRIQSSPRPAQNRTIERLCRQSALRQSVEQVRFRTMKPDHPMKAILVLAAAALLTASVPAKAQRLDVSTVKCKELRHQQQREHRLHHDVDAGLLQRRGLPPPSSTSTR